MIVKEFMDDKTIREYLESARGQAFLMLSIFSPSIESCKNPVKLGAAIPFDG